MKRLLIVLFLASLALAQQPVHTFPATDTNNVFTGTNDFQAISSTAVTLTGQPAGRCVETGNNGLLSLAPAPCSTAPTIAFQTNGTPNSEQTILNLTQGTGVTITSGALGLVTISSSISSITLQHNGIANSSQTLLNLTGGSGIIITDNGSGNISVGSTVAAPTFQTNGVGNAVQSLLNLKNGTGVTVTSDGSGGVTISSSGALTLQTNGVANGSQSLLNLKSGTNIGIVDDGSGGVTITGTTGVNNTNTPQRFLAALGGATTLIGIGFTTSQLGSTSAPLPHSDIDALPTDFSSAASASLNTVMGASGLVNGNGGIVPPKMIARYSMLWTPTTTSNVRYWLGLAQNLVLSNASMAADTPPNTQGGTAVIFCAFRYSATTDTTWKAICQLNNASQTVVDTGVSIVTSTPTLFEIIPNTGTNYTFYINGTLVATITTNIPLSTARMAPFWVADNKNTATGLAATHYSMYLVLKQLAS